MPYSWIYKLLVYWLVIVVYQLVCWIQRVLALLVPAPIGIDKCQGYHHLQELQLSQVLQPGLVLLISMIPFGWVNDPLIDLPLNIEVNSTLSISRWLHPAEISEAQASNAGQSKQGNGQSRYICNEVYGTVAEMLRVDTANGECLHCVRDNNCDGGSE